MLAPLPFGFELCQLFLNLFSQGLLLVIPRLVITQVHFKQPVLSTQIGIIIVTGVAMPVISVAKPLISVAMPLISVAMPLISVGKPLCGCMCPFWAARMGNELALGMARPHVPCVLVFYLFMGLFIYLFMLAPS